jgi:hypothetical protein
MPAPVVTTNPLAVAPRSSRPGQNLNANIQTAPGARPGVVTGGAAPGMREQFTYDANGNRIRRMVPITPPGQPSGAQTPQSGAGGTGPVSSPPNPQPGTNPATGGAGNPSGGPIDPVDVQVGQPTLQSFQQYQDAAYQQAQRRLDPQFQAQEARFEQQMVNRGLQPGTAAYDAARANFDRSREDAYANARNQSLQQGLAAQQQAFGQNLSESELANRLRLGQMSADSAAHIAGLNANTSLAGMDIQRQNFLDQLGLNRDQMNLGASQWDRQFGQNQQQWMDQFGAAQNAQDFGQMMQMMGFDRDTMWGNNQQNNSQFNQLAGLFRMLQPQTPGSQPIDYMSALGMNQNQQNANYQAGMQQSAQNNQNWMALASLFLSDKNQKKVTGRPTPDSMLNVAKKMPLAEFEYDAAPGQPRVGTMAQDFNRLLHGREDTMVNVGDMFGVMNGSVKALDKRLARIERGRR